MTPVEAGDDTRLDVVESVIVSEDVIPGITLDKEDEVSRFVWSIFLRDWT
jgi:hypothetical protein